MKTKLKNFLAASSQYVQACKDNLESFTKFFFFGNFMVFPKKKDS